MKATKVSRGIYQYGKYTVMKVAKDCWRITNPGYGQDFVKKSDAYYWIRNGESFYPPEFRKKIGWIYSKK